MTKNEYDINNELELELTQTHMIQKPMLRVEVCTRALRASHNAKKGLVPFVFALLKQVHGRVLWGCGVSLNPLMF